MIYVGYQGIGKTSLCKKIDKCLDLESSMFILDGKRSDDWYKIYANIAEDLSNQGKIVFISSHKNLRDYLKEHDIPFTVIFPDINLESQWIKKLKDRYSLSWAEKDFRSWITAEKMYKENIEDLSKEKNKIIITDINYSLEELINNDYKIKLIEL